MLSLLHIPSMNPLVYWKGGILLTFERQQALITCDFDANEFSIVVRVPNAVFRSAPRLLLPVLTDALATLLESWYSTEQVDITIPCAHCLKQGNPNPFCFSLSECVHAVTGGNRVMFCQRIATKSRQISVAELAPDLSFADLPIVKQETIVSGSKLGEGGFGMVFRGTMNGAPVALKQLMGEADEESFAEFQREAYIMRYGVHA